MPGLVFRIDPYSLKDALRREMKVFVEMTGTIECLGCNFTMYERMCGTGCQQYMRAYNIHAESLQRRTAHAAPHSPSKIRKTGT